MTTPNHTTQSAIYIILNTKNGKFYIGQAKSTKARWRGHKDKLKCNKHDNKHLQNAWNKYGEKVFRFKILEYCTVEKLNEREQHYLNIHVGSNMCYNIAKDATAPFQGRKHTDETRRKQSEAAKLRPPLSEESKKKMIAALIGRKMEPFSDERKKAMSDARIGKHHSEETRKLMSEHRKGKPSPHRGKKLSLETRQKISASRKGLKLSEASKLKRANTIKENKQKKGMGIIPPLEIPPDISS